jgi:3-hydroxyisobutyrate dehydrogenase-like beta-hydroxyacid dehydrogenase
VVWNRTPGKAGPLVERGAREATTVAEAAGAGDLAVTRACLDLAREALAERGGEDDAAMAAHAERR